MSKSGGILSGEEALESGISLIKKSGKVAAAAVSDTTKAAVSQVAGYQNKDTQDVVSHLYGKTDNKNKDQKENPQNPGDQLQNSTLQDLEKKKKLQELRQQLHNEVYYDPLINPKKPQEQEEERPAEKVEKEKQEEMIDLQKKDKDKPPPLVVRTQQRVEKYPGASG